MAFILVIGASRGIGAEVARQAVAAGHTVRAMSRSGKLPDGVNSDCHGFAGDARHSDDMRQALDGIDIVVQALGIPPSIKMVVEPVTLFSETTKTLISQMQVKGLKRLISVTGFGAGDSHDSISLLQRLPFHLVFGRAYSDKSIQEKLIIQCDLDWLIVRPSVLTNGKQSNHYKVLLEEKDWRNGIIARADVAAFIVAQFGNEGLSHQKPVLMRYPL